MFATPRETAPVTALQDFIAQAAQCPDFRDNIGQLADGIIQFHLTTLAMPFIRKSLDGIGCHERVINERIQVVGMMYVDDLYTRLHIFGLRSGSTPIMVIPVGKLAAAIYFLYRGEQQRKIERQVFAGFESTRTAVCRRRCQVTVTVDTETAFAVVIPAFGISRTIKIQQRTGITSPAQFAMDTSFFGTTPKTVERPQPRSSFVGRDGNGKIVYRLSLIIPPSGIISRGFLPRQTKSHEIRGGFAFHRYLKTDVFNLQLFFRSDGIDIVHPAVKLHRACTSQCQVIVFRLPGTRYFSFGSPRQIDRPV